MRVVSMRLINKVMNIRAVHGISTKDAMDMLVERGEYNADEMPDASVMDALIKGIKLKRRNAYGCKNRRRAGA